MEKWMEDGTLEDTQSLQAWSEGFVAGEALG